MKQNSQKKMFKNKNPGFQIQPKKFKNKNPGFKFPDPNLKGGVFKSNTPVVLCVDNAFFVFRSKVLNGDSRFLDFNISFFSRVE